MPFTSKERVRQMTAIAAPPPEESASNTSCRSTTDDAVASAASRAVALAMAEIGHELLRDGGSHAEAGAFYREADSMSNVVLTSRSDGLDPWRPFVDRTRSTTTDRATTGVGMIGKSIERCHGGRDCVSLASSTFTDDYSYDTNYDDDFQWHIPCGVNNRLCPDPGNVNESAFLSGLREVIRVVHGTNEIASAGCLPAVQTGKAEVAVFEGGSDDGSIPNCRPVRGSRGRLYEI
jgi:hypothetical protein